MASIDPKPWLEAARTLCAEGRLDDAAREVAAALAIAPDDPDALFLAARVSEQRGDAARAESAYRALLSRRPNAVGVLTNLGNLLRRSGRAAEAVPLLQRAEALAPSPPTALNLALALLEAGDLARVRALASSRVLGPDAATWLELGGAAARLAGDIAAALTQLERAVALAPGSAGAWHELAQARRVSGDNEGAAAAFERALSLAPEWERLQWGAALALPALVEDEAAVDAALARFAAGLARLEARVAERATREPLRFLDAAQSVCSFNLQFLPRATTALQSRFGDLIARVVATAVPEAVAPLVPPPPRRRRRVGFVSAYWSSHTVSRYFARFATGLDPDRFERIGWQLGRVDDAEALSTAAALDRFERAAARPLPELMRALRAEQLDALVYLDVGMDPRAHVLAAARLAPLQLALYGHPATTGLPTIDGFVSGALIEPHGAEAHYREPLLRLPGLGASPARGSIAPEPGALASLRDGRPLLLCAQNPSKLIPAFDTVLARVLAGSAARLVLFERGRHLAPRLLARLAKAFAGVGIDPTERVVVLPLQSPARFRGALAEADLVLDTPWFSGGATSLDSIDVGVPLLAFETGEARGRQTAAMLRLAGVPELIATDDDAYVASALALLGDAPRRAALGTRLAAGAKRVFESEAALAAFAELLGERRY